MIRGLADCTAMIERMIIIMIERVIERVTKSVVESLVKDIPKIIAKRLFHRHRKLLRYSLISWLIKTDDAVNR